MRAVELAKVAASAEALRLRRIASRQTMRGAYGAGAAVFALALLAMLHVLGFHLLVPQVGPVWASAILLGVDIVAAAVLGLMAKSNTPDAIETEAKTIREQAVAEMGRAVTVTALAGEAMGAVLRRPSPPGSSRARVYGELASRLMARR